MRWLWYNKAHYTIFFKENLPMKRKLICLLVVLALVLSIPIPGHAASAMKASDDCIAVIKAFEGFSGKPYRDTDGAFTIGYGTRCPDDKVEYYNKNPMTEQEADAELRKEILTYEKAVDAFIDRHGVRFSQGQFDGVVSLVFNCGPSWLTKGKTLIEALSKGYTGNDLIYAFAIYSMSGSNRSIGHVKRRLAEANIYLNEAYSRTPPVNYTYVLYNGNGGTVSTYNVQGYDSNSPVAPIPTATYDGKVFHGWYTEAEGGVKITRLDASTAAKTLYAHWEEGGKPEQTPPSQNELPVIVPDANVTQIVGSLIPGGTSINAVKVTVTGNNVNLRKGPGTVYKVVGSASKGDVFTVTATYQDGDYLWGRYGDGWICLDYTNYDREEKPDDKPETDDAYQTKTYATVKKNQTLNVRTEPDGKLIGTLSAGTRVEILEQKTVADRLWGRYSGGWICLRSLVDLETVVLVPVTVTKTYATVVDADVLNIRMEPDGKIVGSLKKGDRVEILEKKTVANRLWGRCSSGWICLRSLVSLETVTQIVYQEKDLTENAVEARSAFWRVTADTVNVRLGAGTEYPAVAWLHKDEPVVVLEYVRVDGVLWGRTAQGWICLQYLQQG
jgi:uncharacterized repeat protein (TIGR02543 family)